MRNDFIVVRGRSYGRERVMVYRGPQSVQLINGYRYRRSDGSLSSPRQAGHSALSAGRSTTVARRCMLGSIVNPRKRAETGTGTIVTSVTRARGGAFLKAEMNAVRRLAGACAWIVTPDDVLATLPVIR